MINIIFNEHYLYYTQYIMVLIYGMVIMEGMCFINDEFSLFTDFTLLIYLPFFFVFSLSLSHLFVVILGNRLGIDDRQKLFIQVFIILVSF